MNASTYGTTLSQSPLKIRILISLQIAGYIHYEPEELL